MTGQGCAPRSSGYTSRSDGNYATLCNTLRILIASAHREWLWSLNDLRTHMSSTNALLNSEQMYKKRFTQWGLSKNSKRSNCPSAPASIISESAVNNTVQAKARGYVTILPMPLAPSLSRKDSLTLATLRSVSAWSTAYFEGMAHSTITRPRPTVVIDFVFALKMVNSLLDRGEGQLAGRVTRKAFLMLESSLTLDNPALIWNLLEAMYQMTTLRQYTLCKMLLFHLSALVDRQMTRLSPRHMA